MERIKDLFYNYYSNTEECSSLEEMPEVVESHKKLRDFIERYMFSDEVFHEDPARLEFDELATTLSAYSEMQGFVYGYMHAMQMMAECGVKVGDVAASYLQAKKKVV